MSGSPALGEGFASVRDASPRLGAALSARGAGTLARAALLPVLAVAAGDWDPPERAALGPQTCGLAVLAGWLSRDGVELFGPGDAIDPWSDDTVWRACTPVRLAVVGAALAAALEAAPELPARALPAPTRGVRLGAAGGEPAEERLLAALWGLAARWARPGARGPALPPELDTAALAQVVNLPRARTETALQALRAREAVVRGGDGGWELPVTARGQEGVHGRRDRLRARLAEQCTLARAVTEDARALSEQLGATRAAARRRSP